MWWPSYFLYGLSAYSLTALCVRLPGAVRREKCWMADHPRMAGIVLAALAWPVYTRVLRRERERIAPEILRLTDELI